jgi:hypothetical protein
MSMKKSISLASLAIATASTLNAQAAAVVCGGVGNDERREFAAAAQGASLAMQFSLAGRGNFVADVDVTITPPTGAAITLKTDGPICYAELPPGRYKVDARYNGVSRSASANVPAKGAKPARVAMTFPATAADIDPAPVSPEEKLQASKP